MMRKNRPWITFHLVMLIVSIAFITAGCDPSSSDGDGGTGGVAWYRDSDSDGYGDPDSPIYGDLPAIGYVLDNTDCDDGDAGVHPGASETCGDGIDQNCDENIDEGCSLQKLIPSNGAMDDHFGFSVSISGDHAIVGAREGDGKEIDSGAAYIFQRSGSDWVEEAILNASDGMAFNMFGLSVFISGDDAIVGAERADGKEMRSGAAYIFQRSDGNWTEIAKLTASDGTAYDDFGRSVFISGDDAMVGAMTADGKDVDSGAVYIFQRSGGNWIETAKLTASDGAAGDFFSVSLSVYGDNLIVGGGAGDQIGSAYIFQRSGSGWVEAAILNAPDRTAGDRFGLSVSISGDHAIVGVAGDDDKGHDSGSVYIYKDLAENWLNRES